MTVKLIRPAGAEPRLAEAIAQGQIAFLNATAATKTDIANIQRDIERCKADLTWRIVAALLAFSNIIVASVIGALQTFLP